MPTSIEHKPEEIHYPFDHDLLRHYLRLKGALLWIGVLLCLGAFFGFTSVGRLVENPNIPAAAKLANALRNTATGAGCGAALGGLCYLVLTHFRADRESRAASLHVEGPFVRVTLGGFARVDRKLHFRSIIDYSLVEGPLRRRLGLKTLVMSVPAGPPVLGAPAGSVLLTGLRDPDHVRDELAALDAAREHLNG